MNIYIYVLYSCKGFFEFKQGIQNPQDAAISAISYQGFHQSISSCPAGAEDGQCKELIERLILVRHRRRGEPQRVVLPPCENC